MESDVRTIVTFESTAFNMSTSRDYFINPCCFGDDVAEWLIRELRKRGLGTDEEPGQEDFGWYFNFESAGIGHTFVIGHRPTGETEAGTWIGWLERKRGLIGSILGGRTSGIQPSAAQAIHQILIGSSVVQDVRWHLQRDFDTGVERGALSPLAPAQRASPYQATRNHEATLGKVLKLTGKAGLISVFVTPSAWGHAGILPAIYLAFKLQGREKLAGIVPILIVWGVLSVRSLVRADR